MKIAIVKQNSLLREIILDVIKNHFSHYSISAYDPAEFANNEKLAESAELVIIDVDIEIDLTSTYELLHSKNKKIVIWTSNLKKENLENLLTLNLNGYFFNGMEKYELITAIKGIIQGNQYVHPSLLPLFEQNASLPAKTSHLPNGVFTIREWEVLEHLTQGCSNEQIAKSLFISQMTVKNHVSRILKKLEVPDRTNAVLTALRNKWFVI